MSPFLLIKHYYDEEKTELDSSYELQRKDVIAEKDSFLRDFGVSLDGEVNTDSQGDSSELEFEFYPGRPIDAIDSGIHSTICTEVTNIVNCMDNAEYLETRIGFPRVASYSIPIVVISSNAETVSASSVTKMLANLICTLDFNDEKLSKNKRVLISLNKIYEFINKTSEDMVVTYVSDDTQQKIPTRIHHTEYAKRKERITTALDVMKEQKCKDESEETVTGSLLAFNVKNGSFKFKTVPGIEYSGKIVPELKERSFIVGSVTSYTAVIRKSEKVMLVSLEPII